MGFAALRSWLKSIELAKHSTANAAIYCTRIMANQSTADKQIFKGLKDAYNGLIVKSDQEPHDRFTMQNLLKESLKVWADAGLRGIWFEVDNKNHAEWIPVLIQNGFAFHHANAELSVLLKWLPAEEQCNVPLFAHTMVGVGAMVVNKNKEILVVQEKYYKTPHWKLPGGYVDPGETLSTAAMREVLEETGIKTEFVSLISLRHMQPKAGGFKGTYGCSDFYFVAYLKPTDGTEIRMCERELQDARWMNLDEYASHPLVHPNNQLLAKQLIAIDNNEDPTLPLDLIASSHPITGANQQIYLVGKKKFKL